MPAPHYTPTSLHLLPDLPDRTPVLISGHYTRHTPDPARADGTLHTPTHHVRVHGTTFDRPLLDGQDLELWGLLRYTPNGPTIHLHNARQRGDTRLAPSLTTTLGGNLYSLLIHVLPCGTSLTESRDVLRLHGPTLPPGFWWITGQADPRSDVFQVRFARPHLLLVP
ncbi:hypothetical protein [Deinococcus maricopensis]|nr:hypothetical protein [Deinococcus maricopensis]